MSTPRYTPGEWIVRGRFLPHPNETLFIETAEPEPKTICDIQSDAAHAHADARLLAAAPDLLAACQRVLAELEDGITMGCEEDLREAVAKAEGRGE